MAKNRILCTNFKYHRYCFEFLCLCLQNEFLQRFSVFFFVFIQNDSLRQIKYWNCLFISGQTRNEKVFKLGAPIYWFLWCLLSFFSIKWTWCGFTKKWQKPKCYVHCGFDRTNEELWGYSGSNTLKTNGRFPSVYRRILTQATLAGSLAAVALLAWPKLWNWRVL